jgi:hypothetical protein
VFSLVGDIAGPLLPSAVATVVHIDGTPSHPSILYVVKTLYLTMTFLSQYYSCRKVGGSSERFVFHQCLKVEFS